MRYPDYVDKIIKRLYGRGYEAFVVGGGLRDALLGREPNDFDVATSAPPEKTIEAFYDMRTIPTGLSHGTVTVICEGHPVEITTYRIDGEYLDSRHPLSVSFTQNICDDLSRRDFTVNAMAYNKERGLVDPFGGRCDLENKLLRAVGDANERMREDALRIMRALRFAAQLGFDIEEKTELALSANREGLKKISPERKGAELAKLVVAPFSEMPLRKMISLGISEYILGGYIPSDKILSAMPKLSSDVATRLGALLFECEYGEARKILRGLRFSNTLADATLAILESRNVPQPESDADVRRFLLRFGKLSENAAEVRAAIVGDAVHLCEDIKRVREDGFCDGIRELAINGSDLLAMGYDGKTIGAALGYLLDAVTEDPAANTKEKLTALLEKFGRQAKTEEKWKE